MDIHGPHDASLAAIRLQVEQRLRGLLPPVAGPADAVGAALHAAVLGPGKRLRPLLVLVVGRALGAAPASLLDLACAVELVHCASLVLDDMPAMDNALLRRGEPTVHVRFGEDVAMLAAVALVTEACRVAATAPALDAAVRAEAVQVLCAAMGPRGLVRGQFQDLRESSATRTVEEVARANDLKTGVLFACAFELAARAACRPGAVPALRRAAMAIGQAFQLRDDLEDVDASTATREDAGQDAGKGTLVEVLGAGAVRAMMRTQLADAAGHLREALQGEDELIAHLMRKAFPAEDLRAAADPQVRAATVQPALALAAAA